MQHGTEETTIKQVVQCRGFSKLVTIETCQHSCHDFGGIHKEPVHGRDEEGNMVLLRHDHYIKCKRLRLLPFQPVGEVMPASADSKEG